MRAERLFLFHFDQIIQLANDHKFVQWKTPHFQPIFLNSWNKKKFIVSFSITCWFKAAINNKIKKEQTDTLKNKKNRSYLSRYFCSCFIFSFLLLFLLLRAKFQAIFTLNHVKLNFCCCWWIFNWFFFFVFLNILI